MNHLNRLLVDIKNTLKPSQVVSGITVYKTIQSHTPHTGVTYGANFSDTGIGRALVNANPLIVGIQISIRAGQLDEIGAVWIIPGNPAADPAAVVHRAIGAVQHHAVVVIAGVHLPGDLQLL